ncbi:hypothetical protein AAH991_08755 [Microbispora sp. ZYX-F-249]|uniref:Uncharacterized protein n=1 Tax=Microbispora maris TaxID=3144104 RepID=A0ABV0AIM7_9ACTN
MKVPVRQLLWGLIGVVTALATYVVVAFFLFIATLSLYTIPILVVYTPPAFLAIGVLGAALSMKALTRAHSPRPKNVSRLSFWCGWAICPAGYLVLLIFGS